MPAIELEPDVYDYLRARADFGETLSGLLRRLHNLPTPTNGHVSTNLGSESQAPSVSKTTSMGALGAFVEDSGFKYKGGTATDKYLAVMAFVQKQNPKEFEKVLHVGGRSRKYFGRSRAEIEKSGTSTHPKQIPGTDFWAMTNADTRQKCDVMAKALRILGYPEQEIKLADAAIF